MGEWNRKNNRRFLDNVNIKVRPFLLVPDPLRDLTARNPGIVTSFGTVISTEACRIFLKERKEMYNGKGI